MKTHQLSFVWLKNMSSFLVLTLFTFSSFSQQVLLDPVPVFVTLKTKEISTWLQNAPLDTDPSARNKTIIVELPDANGEMMDFVAYNSPIMSAEMQAKTPNIYTYFIEGLETPTTTGRITVSPIGISGLIYAETGRYMIQPEEGSKTIHRVFLAPFDPARTHPEGKQDMIPFERYIPDDAPIPHTHANSSTPHTHNNGGLRAFNTTQGQTTRRVVDLFIVADFEYYDANDGGNTPGTAAANTAVDAAIVSQINSVNAIYQRDLNVRLNLTNKAFFADDADDSAFFVAAANEVPEHVDDALKYFDSAVLTDVPGDNITGIVALSSFDAGFYFSGKTDAANASGAGAALSAHEDGIICADDGNGEANDNMIGGVLAPLKGGAGASAGAAAFTMSSWIDVVAHELGHAFGASHTWSSNQESCEASQFDNLQSYEIGSGSTLMSYLGICGDDPLVAPDDNIVVGSGENNAYFHLGSIHHINNYLNGANTPVPCVTTEANSNANLPVISQPAASGTTATIPQNTPFMLTGAATDADGQGLTYTWEQTDLAAAAFNFSFAAANNTSGPIIRSREPSSSPTRFIPQLESLKNGAASTNYPYELLPTTNRTLTFNFAARDGAGGVVSHPLTITVDGTTALAVPNPANTTWNVGTTQTVTWSNGGGGCGNVKIMLSTDGGATFPTTLLASTPNNGSQDITVPNNVTSTARVMVICETSNCVAPFNINATNFTIAAALPVELAAINARKMGAKNIVEWATLSEENNAGFEVQRSTDARTWEKRTFVKGKENSHERNDYQWIDETPKTGINYYRLKQMDIDGTFEFSPVVSVSRAQAEKLFELMPNPNSGEFSIQINDELTTAASIEILTIEGKLLNEYVVNDALNSFNISHLPTGIYLVRLIAGQQVTTQKLMIER